MVASVDTQDGFSAGQPEALFDVRAYVTLGPNYAASPDGERFLMVKAPKEDQIILVQNWLDELERLVPVD
jgi:hypothetical protein